MENNIVVDRNDIKEFNQWLNNKNLTPRLKGLFESDDEYEKYMLDFDPTESTFSSTMLPMIQSTYNSGDKYYDYLRGLNPEEFDALTKELNSNGLSIEYIQDDDNFRVFSKVNSTDVTEQDMIEFNQWIKGKDVKPKLRKFFDSDNEYEDFMIEHTNTSTFSSKLYPAGTYGPGTDEYKYLDSLDETNWQEIIDQYHKNSLDVSYDVFEDEFTVADKSFSKINLVEPGIYGNNTKVYKELEKLEGDDWTNYMDEMAQAGMTIEYDTVEDQFVVTSTMDFSNQEREKVSDADLKKAQEEGVVQKKPNGKWGIISIDAKEWWTQNYDTKESAENALKAYHANKSARTFTDRSIDAVTVETTNPDKLVKILETIKSHGNVGHTFDIAIDYKDERQEIIQWDGDGSDRIENITINNTNESSKRTFSNKSDNMDNSSNKSFSDSDIVLDDDTLKAIVALALYDNNRFFDDLETIDFDERVEILEDAVQEVFPKDKKLFDKSASLINFISMLSHKHIIKFNNN